MKQQKQFPENVVSLPYPGLPTDRKSSTSRPSWPRRVFGGVIGFVGFLLSPLSWWNDLFINVPLALAFAWVVSLLYPPAFWPLAVVGYAGSNVLGFALMDLGVRILWPHASAKPRLAMTKFGAPPRRRLPRNISFALLYTIAVLVLVHVGFLKPLETCLAGKWERRSTLAFAFRANLPATE